MTNVSYIEVEAGVRYWEDASVNGVNEDNDAPTIYGAHGETWKVSIRLRDGLILGWPKGTTASVHYKVCDAGEYWLGHEGGRVAKWSGSYVPSDFLCQGDDGYGDYIIMNIGADGIIEGYQVPELSEVDWVRLDMPTPLTIGGPQ